MVAWPTQSIVGSTPAGTKLPTQIPAYTNYGRTGITVLYGRRTK